MFFAKGTFINRNGKMFFRTEPLGIEYPAHWAKKEEELTESEKDRIVSRFNYIGKERLAMNKMIHPENEREYIPLNYEQIVKLIDEREDI